MEWNVHCAFRLVCCFKQFISRRNKHYEVKIKHLTSLSELTTQPEIDRFEDSDIAEKEGKRLIVLTWVVIYRIGLVPRTRSIKVNSSSLWPRLIIVSIVSFLLQSRMTASTWPSRKHPERLRASAWTPLSPRSNWSCRIRPSTSASAPPTTSASRQL